MGKNYVTLPQLRVKTGLSISTLANLLAGKAVSRQTIEAVVGVFPELTARAAVISARARAKDCKRSRGRTEPDAPPEIDIPVTRKTPVSAALLLAPFVADSMFIGRVERLREACRQAGMTVERFLAELRELVHKPAVKP